MKKILILVAVIIVVAFFYPKNFISSPGFVPQEAYQEFEANKPKCYGYERLTNAQAMAADAPGKSQCFGWLVR